MLQSYCALLARCVLDFLIQGSDRLIYYLALPTCPSARAGTAQKLGQHNDRAVKAGSTCVCQLFYSPLVQPLTVNWSGQCERPWKKIDPTFLLHSLPLCSLAKLASVLNCLSKTVQKRVLEAGLAFLCLPVYKRYEQPNGMLSEQ